MRSYLRRWQTYLLLATVAGLVAVLYAAYSSIYTEPDIIVQWRGARFWLSGIDPYGPQATFLLTGSYSSTASGVAYPFPVILLMIPLALLPLPWAATIWTLISLLTVLALPIVLLERPSIWAFVLSLLYFPFLASLEEAQWGPVLLAFALVSLHYYRTGRQQWSGFVLPLALLKPQVGIALFLAVAAFVLLRGVDRRWWYGIALGFAIWWGASLLIAPDWPLGWLGQIQRYSDENQNAILALLPLGAVVLALAALVAALAWRRRDAEVVLGAVLLIGLLALPTRSVYNQVLFLLPLVMLAGRRPRAVAAAILLSWGIFALLFLGVDALGALALALYAPPAVVLVLALYPMPWRLIVLDRPANEV
jgi:hypothetical protein